MTTRSLTAALLLAACLLLTGEWPGSGGAARSASSRPTRRPAARHQALPAASGPSMGGTDPLLHPSEQALCGGHPCSGSGARTRKRGATTATLHGSQDRFAVVIPVFHR